MSVERRLSICVVVLSIAAFVIWGMYEGARGDQKALAEDLYGLCRALQRIAPDMLKDRPLSDVLSSTEVGDLETRVIAMKRAVDEYAIVRACQEHDDWFREFDLRAARDNKRMQQQQQSTTAPAR